MFDVLPDPHVPGRLQPWSGPSTTTARPSLSELTVLTRLLRVAPAQAGGAIAEATLPLTAGPTPLAGSDQIELIEPFAPAEGTASAWTARARLGRRSPLQRSVRVELSVSASSASTCHLVVRPATRSPHAWGVRRLRRYFDLAHLAADDLERRIGRAARAERSEPPIELPRPVERIEHDPPAAA